jgi:hypothetical protein
MVEVQKQGTPNDRKPDKWERDLHPTVAPGRNHGLEGSHPEKEDIPTAYDLKDVHRYLDQEGYTNAELQQIIVMPPGSRLEQGATYIDLKDPQRQEFTAMGNMEADSDRWYVPKTEIDYQLWNRLTLVQNPERLGQTSDE